MKALQFILLFLFMPLTVLWANGKTNFPFRHIDTLYNYNNQVCSDTIKKKSPSLFILNMRFYDTPVLNLNLQQGWRTMGEVAFGLADYQAGRKSLGLYSLASMEIGSLFNFKFNHIIIGPELSYNASYLLFNFGASMIYYTDFNKGTLYLNPHLGFSFDTFADIYVGYNIPLMHNNMKSLVNNFTLTGAFPILNRKVD